MPAVGLGRSSAIYGYVFITVENNFADSRYARRDLKARNAANRERRISYAFESGAR